MELSAEQLADPAAQGRELRAAPATQHGVSCSPSPLKERPGVTVSSGALHLCGARPLTPNH